MQFHADPSQKSFFLLQSAMVMVMAVVVFAVCELGEGEGVAEEGWEMGGATAGKVVGGQMVEGGGGALMFGVTRVG